MKKTEKDFDVKKFCMSLKRKKTMRITHDELVDKIAYDYKCDMRSMDIELYLFSRGIEVII